MGTIGGAQHLSGRKQIYLEEPIYSTQETATGGPHTKLFGPISNILQASIFNGGSYSITVGAVVATQV